MATKVRSWLYESRSLKKPRLGPSDVYPQDPRQKEDELTASNVSKGFSIYPSVQDEYGSARNSNITPNKFGAFFSALLSRKQELNTFQDNGKKKPLTNAKDNVWLVTQRSKNAVDSWFKDLCSDAKTLQQLSRKVPIFNKKEEIFLQLYEFQVPMSKAAWFIKMSSAYSISLSESNNKSKKRQMPDQSQEWTSVLCKFLRDLFQKICDYYQVSNSPMFNNSTNVNIDLIYKQWEYCTSLARHLFEEGLLDRQEFLNWILDLLEKIKNVDDSAMRIVVWLILQYVDNFTESELCSRRLAYHCAKKLNQLISDYVPNGVSEGNQIDPLALSFRELLYCPHHRISALGLSAIIQIITIKCPIALIWHNIGEGRVSPALNGSPLDHLPCAPSALPMPARSFNKQLKESLRDIEEEIRLRSKAVENKWCLDRSAQTAPGAVTNRLLNTLDALDRHGFDKTDSNNSLDSLYCKIFTSEKITNDAQLKEVVKVDEPVIKLLCEWAVTTKRTGEHRSLVVAKLLERRQGELIIEKDDKEEKEGDPVYQDLLTSFLDHQAPIWEGGSDSKLAFSNLVLLFGELIRCDVFSHDAYMRALISRGQFANPPVEKVKENSTLPSLSTTHVSPLDVNNSCRSLESSLPMFEPVSAGPSSGTRVDGMAFDRQQLDNDDAKLDADLDKLLQHIKEEQQNNLKDQTDILLPDSVGSDKEEETCNILSSIAFGDSKKDVQRHLLYTTHFPLPQDESTNHDCNQRHVLLYGVGKARDDARHLIKKTTKELLKLFNRKSSMDISEGAKIKKKEAFNFESALTRFQSLAYFDQHVVTSSCAATCIEMFDGVGNGNSVYLPLIESIAFLFDLMEMALNIHGLIEFVIQLLKEMPDVEAKLIEKCPILSGSYCTTIGLYITGVLYRYQACLLVSQEETLAVFDGLFKLVKNVISPSDCTSAERCIFSYLYDLWCSCSLIRSRYFDVFNILQGKIKQVINAPQTPSAVDLSWSSSCMSEYIINPKMKIDINQLKQLNDNAPYRFSFVCNALRAVTIAKDVNRLNELSILCAELTSRCTVLSGEWLGVLKALCCSSNHTCGFVDILSQISVSDVGVHDNLAVFTSILIARRCFSLQDFIIHCALPSLLALSPSGGGGPEAESGARLTCHLLLCLFRTGEPPLSSTQVVSTPATTLYSLTSPAVGVAGGNVGVGRMYVIKHPCDRYLLAAAHSTMRAEAVLTLLKAILVLSDSVENSQSKIKSENGSNNEISISEILGPMDDADLGEFGLLPFSGGNRGTRTDTNSGIELAGLSEFAKHALKQISSQEWVLERCLRDPEMLCKEDLLLDSMLSHKQAQQLLQMICHPKSPPPEEMDQKHQITKILCSLDEWTMRISWLQLQLMYTQCSQASSDISGWLDAVAKAVVDYFQASSSESGKRDRKNDRVWLVAPLVSKLTPTVQGKILKVAANVLESGSWMAATVVVKKDKKGTNTSSMLLSYPPFLSLVLMCLKGQDEQRESLLNSLYNQLNQAIKNEDKGDDIKAKIDIQEGLQLRLSLVGGMFDMIQKSASLASDWAILLLQLISCGVVDPQLNYELFTTILDMLAVLIHTIQAFDGDSREETRKSYLNLMKKLKKEFPFEKVGYGVAIVRQLLPLGKRACEVITCEPMGSLIDTKGNKIAGFNSIDKKQGLQVAEKQRVSPWDLLEGSKNPAPLSWPWFGAVKMERKPLRGEENHSILAWHTHPFKRETSYYLEPPPLPAEEPSPVPTPIPVVDMKPVVIPEEIKREREIEDSPRPAKKPKTQRRRRAPKGPPAGAIRPTYEYGSQWYGNQTTGFYGPPASGPTGTRYERPMTNSKALLNTMIKSRQPGGPNAPYIAGQGMPGPGTPNQGMGQGPPMGQQIGPGQAMNSGSTMGPTQNMAPAQPIGATLNQGMGPTQGMTAGQAMNATINQGMGPTQALPSGNMGPSQGLNQNIGPGQAINTNTAIGLNQTINPNQNLPSNQSLAPSGTMGQPPGQRGMVQGNTPHMYVPQQRMMRGMRPRLYSNSGGGHSVNYGMGYQGNGIGMEMTGGYPMMSSGMRMANHPGTTQGPGGCIPGQSGLQAAHPQSNVGQIQGGQLGSTHPQSHNQSHPQCHSQHSRNAVFHQESFPSQDFVDCPYRFVKPHEWMADIPDQNPNNFYSNSKKM